MNMNKASQLSKSAILLTVLMAFIQAFCTAEVLEPEEREVPDVYGLGEDSSQTRDHEKNSRRKQHRLHHIGYWDPEIFSEIDSDYLDNAETGFDDDFDVSFAEDDTKELFGRQKRSTGSLPRWFRLYCFTYVCGKPYSCRRFVHPKGRQLCHACQYSVCRHSVRVLNTET